ncbi:MAG TPA: YdcF family protein, partial [Pyrinomonadaceae bacterium]|nr:YdcF family protein [Pyrinomonadaceae bacterium]
MKKIAKTSLLILSILALVCGLLASRIYSFSNASSDASADAAVVLGAAVWTAQVSPVFRERTNHGIDLYRTGKVPKIIFTGGQGNPGEPTESSAARQYALQRGIPAADVLIEEKSHTTYENILYAKQLADSHGIKKVLIVSDPLHMRRAVAMATDVGLVAEPSPTPSTRYQGLRTQMTLLAHETYYYLGYLLRRPFL